MITHPAWKALCSCLSSNNNKYGIKSDQKPLAADESLEQLREALAKQGSAVSETSTKLEQRIILALREAGKLKEALALANASEARVRSAYGTAHSLTLLSQWLLATVLHRLGATAPSGDGVRDAQALHRQVLALRLKLHGAAHPRTTESQYELGLTNQVSLVPRLTLALPQS